MEIVSEVPCLDMTPGTFIALNLELGYHSFEALRVTLKAVVNLFCFWGKVGVDGTKHSATSNR